MKICEKKDCLKEHEKPGKFCSRGCANSRTWTDDDKKAKSLAAGGTGVLKTKIEKLRIDKTKECLECKTLTTNKVYCSKACDIKNRQDKKLKENLTLFENGKLKYRRSIYKFLIIRDGNKCSRCGIENWNGQPIRFWVDHVDGNSTNNIPTNFRLICPNCDSQSETFGARNWGSGRRKRGVRDYD